MSNSMASARSLRETVGDVTECSICTETMVDPRVLPCIHTFCFKCLDLLWKDKQPGVKVPCPLCRADVVIPVKGVSDLPKNFFVEKLVEAQKISETDTALVNCDICLKQAGHEGTASASETFCVECKQHMCERCSKFHNALSTTSTHHVIPTGSKLTVVEGLIKFPEARCETHKGKEIEIYCMECEVAVCTICFITKHNRHECSDIQQVADDLKKQIKSNIQETRCIVVEVNKQSKALEQLSVNFDLSVKEAQAEIIQAGEKIKQMIEKHVQALLRELDNERAQKVKEFELVKEELLVRKITLESFIKYSETILDKAVPADVASVSKDLAVRFQSLKHSEIKQIVESLAVIFTPNESQWLHEDDRNFIGTIKLNGCVFGSYSRKSGLYDQDPTPCSAIQFAGRVRGIAVSGEELYVVTRDSNEVQVFNSTTLSPQSSISVTGLTDSSGIAANENSLFVGSLRKIYRVALRDKSVTSWPVRVSWALLSVNKLGNVIVTINEENKLYEYTPVGRLLREIALNVVGPHRTIHMENDQFLVCQAGKLHQVCLVDNRGNLIKSFGSTKGSGNANLKYPYDFIVDRSGFILVADSGNRRVVLLNKQLEYVKDLIPGWLIGEKILKTFLDEDNGKLYLSYLSAKRLAIFDLKYTI